MSIELLAVLSKTAKMTKLVITLRNFVENDMVTYLSTIEKVGNNAAAEHLRNMKSSANPSRQVEAAITELVKSYNAFVLTGPESEFSLIRVGWTVAARKSSTKRVKFERRGCEYALLIGICHMYVNDPPLARKYLLKARKHFDRYADIRTSRKYHTTSSHSWAYYQDGASFTTDDIAMFDRMHDESDEASLAHAREEVASEERTLEKIIKLNERKLKK